MPKKKKGAKKKKSKKGKLPGNESPDQVILLGSRMLFNVDLDFLSIVICQVRIKDLCKGAPSEILPTSRCRVAVTAKTWASKLGVVGGGPAPPPRPSLDPHLYVRPCYPSTHKLISINYTCNVLFLIYHYVSVMLQVMHRLLRSYEKNCLQCESLIDHSLKKALQNGKEKAALLTKVALLLGKYLCLRIG